MKLALQLKFFFVLATALLGLAVAGAAYATLGWTRDAQVWVSHTHEVMGAISDQQARLVEAESAQRGYLLARDPDDLGRYQHARALALAGVAPVMALTADNDDQQRRLAALDDAVRRRVQILDEVLDRSGLPAGPRLADGRNAMAESRGIAADVTRAERALLDVRVARVQKRTSITKLILVVGSLLAFGLTFLTMRDLKREVDGRERARYVTEAQAIQLAEQAKSLEASRDAAEAANRTKSMFLANMSHELRTPLNAVLGYSEMLQEEASERGVDDFIPDLKSIHAAGKHLLGLINDVLDLSKIEAGKMDLFLEDFEVAGMLDEVERTIRPLVAEKGNELVIERGRLPVMHADLTKVRQTLFNILSNAAKFTEHGVIRLRAGAEERAGRSVVLFRVTDSGIGMNEEQIARLFEPFVQADASTTRKFGGTGLGLAISRRFCRMMGGEITVESKAGRGSTFTVEIPAAVVAPSTTATEGALPARRSAPDSTTARPVVLVIDDDPDTREIMDRHLTRDGFSVVLATSGAEGLRLAREIQPVAITLDVMMPTTDGWAVLTALKADAELREIPVVMVTMVTDRGLGYHLGASEFMTKPIDRARLSQVLARYRRSGAAGVALVVEDDGATRRVTRTMLERDGWTVVEAEDGAVALERLRERRPDVVLLDLMMPTMDGFELAATLHAHAEWKAIPIVVMTAKDITDEDRVRLTGYVEKIVQKGAYDVRRLLDEVRDIVASHARQRAAQVRNEEAT